MNFNDATTPATMPLTREDYRISHGHMVLWGIREIQPMKAEMEALGDDYDREKDIRTLVPWHDGIVIKVIALRSRDLDGNVRELYEQDPNGNVNLPFGHKYLTYYTRVDLGEVERGWARKYTGDKRKILYSLPDNFMQMTNMQRFAYWRDMLGGKFGFEPGQLQEGATFYTYLTLGKGRNGKTYTDLRKVYRDDQGLYHDESPTDIGSIDLTLLRKLDTTIAEGYARAREQSDDTSFNFGANSNRRQDDDASRVVGF